MHIQPSPDPRSQVRMPYLPCPILASNAEKKETKRENSRVEEKERNPNRGLLSHPLPLTSSSRWIPPAPPPAGALRLLSPDPPSSLPRPPSSSARWLCSFRRNRKLVELVAPLVVHAEQLKAVTAALFLVGSLITYDVSGSWQYKHRSGSRPLSNLGLGQDRGGARRPSHGLSHRCPA